MKYAALIRLAKHSQHHQFKHVSILIKGHVILNWGVNNSNRHSEIAAIKGYEPEQLHNSMLVNFRMTKTGKLANSKPCDDCMEVLLDSGVRIIWYSTPEGFEKLRIY